MDVIFHIHPLDDAFDFPCNVGADAHFYTIPFVILTLVNILWGMAKYVIQIIKIEVAFVMSPVGQGFYMFIIKESCNCLEDVLDELQGNKMLLSLGFKEGFLLGMSHRCFRNIRRNSHDEWKRVLHM